MKIKVFGCGGVGLWLLSPLCKFLAFADGDTLKGPHQITLIDGDKFEEKNRNRQQFHREGNKAEVTREWLEREFGDKLFFFAEPVFLEEKNAPQLVREGDLVFGCVDNHVSRRILSRRAVQLNNVTVIAGGNDYEDGGIQCHVRKDGVNVTLPLENEFHTEIGDAPEDNHPVRLAALRGCAAEAPSSPQLVFTNLNVSVCMLNAFYAHVRGRLDYDECYLDVLHNTWRVERRTQNHG